jgi:ribosomal protein S18 acetylase RimI-like enzyme
MKINRLSLSETIAILELGKGEPCFTVAGSKFWPLSILEDWINSPTNICIAAKEGNKIIGFALTATHAETRKAHLENLYVIPTERGKGVGTHLMRQVLIRAKKRNMHFVSVVTLNKNMQGILHHSGFINYGNWHLKTL